ncbi:HEPN domain-containing protein [Thermococcus siculi]|uniref:HEPN domain-containing protein n=1 Tax=Thermococcus siculi TaxID=72803 RepID=UPI00202A243E|nr:HEPN domain-containing protein [Thermococcus siculi]
MVEEHYGKALTKAFQLRSKADYNVMYLPSREEAEEILNSAEDFLEKARELIEEWRRKEQ